MARSILHMLTPLRHMSPFDVNMAVDAGFETVVTYAEVSLADVVSLTQDSIFSRAPGDGTRTGIFIGGKNAEDALDMVDRAKKAFVPPFVNHVFADPAGSFTTGAAMVAQVSRALRQKFGTDLRGKRIVIFGGAGVVAYVAAVIGALEGATTVLVGHDGEERVSKIAFTMKWRFGIEVGAVDGTTPEDRRAAIREADVILSAGPAGIPILTAEDLKSRAEAPRRLGRQRRAAGRHRGDRRQRRRRGRCPPARASASARWPSATSSTRRSGASSTGCSAPIRRSASISAMLTAWRSRSPARHCEFPSDDGRDPGRRPGRARPGRGGATRRIATLRGRSVRRLRHTRPGGRLPGAARAVRCCLERRGHVRRPGRSDGSRRRCDRPDPRQRLRGCSRPRRAPC